MINVVQKRKPSPAVGQANKLAAGSNNSNSTNQNNKRAPQKKKTKSSSKKKAAPNQQQQQQPQNQQQVPVVQMNNQPGQGNDDQVWIFGLINNIEQLLATFNSVNNQSSLQQQQHQQHLSFSNKSPPSGYSTPSALASPFVLSSSTCSSSYSSAQSTSNSPVCSPKLSHQMTSSNLYANNNNINSSQGPLFGATIGQQQQQQQQQVIGLQQSTQGTNFPQHQQQQQLPRSPLSRQIKFHEYKGPPQVKRPANNNQKQSNGSTANSQKAPTSSSSSLSATSNTSNGVQGKANNANTNNKTMATNQIETTLAAGQVVKRPQLTDCNNNKNVELIQRNVNSLESVSMSHQLQHQQQHHHQQQQQRPTTTTTLCLNKMTSFSGDNQMIPNQTMIQAQPQARQEAQLFRIAPATPSLGTQVISSGQQQQQQLQQTIYVTPTSEMINCGQQQFVVIQEQPQQQQYQAHLSSSSSLSNCNYLAPNTSQEQLTQRGNFATNFEALGEQHQRQEEEEETALVGVSEDPTQQFNSSMMTSSELEQSNGRFVDSYGLMGANQMEMAHDVADDDTCDIEPTICFSNGQNSANFDETLLFSEYIDLQDIPMNVNESDWLKKFLPPCSMS